MGEGINEALISVDIPEEILEGRAGAEAWDYDSTRSVKIYVYISYSCLFDEVQYMKLSQVKGKWIQLDGDVSCTTLKVAARCYGDFYTTGFCNRYNYGNVSYPTSGVYYSLTPSWSTQYVNITYLGYSQQGITTAYLKRGISTWSATIYLGNACLW